MNIRYEVQLLKSKHDRQRIILKNGEPITIEEAVRTLNELTMFDFELKREIENGLR